jgi:hypothetical protein
MVNSDQSRKRRRESSSSGYSKSRPSKGIRIDFMDAIKRNLATYVPYDMKFPRYEIIPSINELIEILIRFISEDENNYTSNVINIAGRLKNVFMMHQFERTNAIANYEDGIYKKPERCENINAYENRQRYNELFTNNLYLVFLVNIAIKIRDTYDIKTLRIICILLTNLEEQTMSGVLYIPNIDLLSDLSYRNCHINTIKKSSMDFYYRNVMSIYNENMSKYEQSHHNIHTFACHTIHFNNRSYLHIPCVLPSIPICNTLLILVARNREKILRRISLNR